MAIKRSIQMAGTARNMETRLPVIN
jgi:hypothetical protein